MVRLDEESRNQPCRTNGNDLLSGEVYGTAPMEMVSVTATKQPYLARDGTVLAEEPSFMVFTSWDILYRQDDLQTEREP